MKRIHIAISVQDIAASVADYSQRLDCKPYLAQKDLCLNYLWNSMKNFFTILIAGS